jgi:hypothetical protein
LAAAHSGTSEDRPLIVRVRLTGQTALAGFLRDSASLLRDEIRSIAAAISPQLWLEKLVVCTTAPPLSTAVEGAEEIASILAGASSDSELIERLHSEFAQFLTSTSAPELVDEGTLTPFARKGDWRPIIEAAASALLARLQQAG